MRKTFEEKRKKYRAIFDLFEQTPRVSIPDITSAIGGNKNKTEKRIEEAISQLYVSFPQIRARSYREIKEYITLVHYPIPYHAFGELIKDLRVSYHAKITGFWNMWLISEKKIDVNGNIMFEGYRSDYHISHPPNHSWDVAIKRMENKISNFKEEDSTSEILKFRLDQSIKWNPQFEALYRYFKYNLRKPQTPIMRDQKIPSDVINDFLSNIDRYFTVFAMYYPETITAYEPYLHMIETDHEDFIINLFSELPTTSWFFKVKDKLFMLLYPKRELVRMVNHHSKMEDLHIPMMLADLMDQGIIKEDTTGIVTGYWAKDL